MTNVQVGIVLSIISVPNYVGILLMMINASKHSLQF